MLITYKLTVDYQMVTKLQSVESYKKTNWLLRVIAKLDKHSSIHEIAWNILIVISRFLCVKYRTSDNPNALHSKTPSWWKTAGSSITISSNFSYLNMKLRSKLVSMHFSLFLFSHSETERGDVTPMEKWLIAQHNLPQKRDQQVSHLRENWKKNRMN